MNRMLSWFAEEGEVGRDVAGAHFPFLYAFGRIAHQPSWIDVIARVGYEHFFCQRVDFYAVWNLYALFRAVGYEVVAHLLHQARVDDGVGYVVVHGLVAP